MLNSPLRSLSQSNGLRKTLLFSIPVVVVAVILGTAIGKNVIGKSTLFTEQKEDIVLSVQRLGERAIYTDNSEQGPLFIGSAQSLEIEGRDFEMLTSSKATASNYVRFPQAKLTNTSAQSINQATICMVRSEISERTCLRYYDLKLAPGAVLDVKPKDWALPANRMQIQLDGQGGQFSKTSNKADIQSDKMWLPGRIPDFTLELQSVKFEDNSKWVTKH